jgi:hypothetical protein
MTVTLTTAADASRCPLASRLGETRNVVLRLDRPIVRGAGKKTRARVLIDAAKTTHRERDFSS